MSEKLKRILALPCIGVEGGTVTVTFKSQIAFAREAFEADPLTCMRIATERLEEGVRQAVADKRRVLNEIDSGRNRYSVVSGGFAGVGSDEKASETEGE